MASPSNHRVIPFADAAFSFRTALISCLLLEIAIVIAMPLAEKGLIKGIRRLARAAGSAVRLGIGDDCAVLRPPRGHEILVTTDFTLENIHFRRAWHAPEVVGHRCLTRGLSDIAAMGGKPLAAFLSLALPAELPQNWVDRFMRGLLALAREHNVPLAGGDTAQSPKGILADIVVVGSVPNGMAVMRSGAKPGDRIYVTGELGSGTAALREFLAGRKPRAKDYSRHFHPVPRLEVGEFLRSRGIPTAMIDLSDGLSTDLAHICEESRVGAEVAAGAIPRARVGSKRERVALKLALHGGEDYELLFTAPNGKRVPASIAGVSVTPIGRITRGRRILMRTTKGTEPLKPEGWEHFRGSS